MGTYIELTVDGVTIDWSKNGVGDHHGVLFQEGDRTRRSSNHIDYEYHIDHPEDDLDAEEAAFVRPLARVLPRLDLLGYTLEAARAEYEDILQEELSILDLDDPAQKTPALMTFDEFCAFACRHPLKGLDGTYIEHGRDNRDKLVQGRFLENAKEILRIPGARFSDLQFCERSYFTEKVRILSPYSMLQVFGQSERNADAEVVWQYGPLVQSGWADAEAFAPGAWRGQDFLVATEGTSDARIIKHALSLLQPDVADFFRFVDVNERHPFWGTGNLVKFAEGLVRIGIQNQVIFLLDNDAEGLDAFNRLETIGMSGNMRAMLLLDLDVFRHFPARGPDGVTACDINGRAAAIECYLDLSLPGYPSAQVLWSNYKKEIDAWQGVLEHKETYMRYFLEQTAQTVSCGIYDTSKLKEVLKALIGVATSLGS